MAVPDKNPFPEKAGAEIPHVESGVDEKKVRFRRFDFDGKIPECGTEPCSFLPDLLSRCGELIVTCKGFERNLHCNSAHVPWRAKRLEAGNEVRVPDSIPEPDTRDCETLGK